MARPFGALDRGGGGCCSGGGFRWRGEVRPAVGRVSILPPGSGVSLTAPTSGATQFGLPASPRSYHRRSYWRSARHWFGPLEDFVTEVSLRRRDVGQLG